MCIASSVTHNSSFFDTLHSSPVGHDLFMSHFNTFWLVSTQCFTANHTFLERTSFHCKFIWYEGRKSTHVLVRKSFGQSRRVLYTRNQFNDITINYWKGVHTTNYGKYIFDVLKQIHILNKNSICYCRTIM